MKKAVRLPAIFLAFVMVNSTVVLGCEKEKTFDKKKRSYIYQVVKEEFADNFGVDEHDLDAMTESAEEIDNAYQNGIHTQPEQVVDSLQKNWFVAALVIKVMQQTKKDPEWGKKAIEKVCKYIEENDQEIEREICDGMAVVTRLALKRAKRDKKFSSKDRKKLVEEIAVKWFFNSLSGKKYDHLKSDELFDSAVNLGVFAYVEDEVIKRAIYPVRSGQSLMIRSE